MVSTEKETQKAVLQLLKLYKIFHYRNNSGGMTSTYKGKTSFMRFGYPGSPDIVAVIGGKYVALEIKDIKGKLNDNQIKFKADLEKAGGIYVTIRSVDDFLNFLKSVDN